MSASPLNPDDLERRPELPEKGKKRTSILPKIEGDRKAQLNAPELNFDSSGAFGSALYYFFTQTFFASSHFMSFVFSQSAFVVGTAGASAANAGAVNASKRVATIALLRNLTDIEVSSFKLGHLMTPGLTMHL